MRTKFLGTYLFSPSLTLFKVLKLKFVDGEKKAKEVDRLVWGSLHVKEKARERGLIKTLHLHGFGMYKLAVQVVGFGMYRFIPLIATGFHGEDLSM